ncbi:MAG: tRNA nucleotidyltransferase, partial [Chlorobiaceae bacterium]|nr:tRNA nucleotidyltransferase [Chlorobiaceae bacterium]
MDKKIVLPIPAILEEIGDLADRKGMTAYVVGGYVRDMLMHRSCSDIDIMVIGDPLPFAHAIQHELPGKNLVVFERFRTAQLDVSDSEKQT